MSTKTTGGHDSVEPVTEPAAAVAAAPWPLAGFAAGVTGAALLVAGVWGLHMLSPTAEGVGAVALLLAAVTALGKGITLLQRALTPVTAAGAVAVSGIPALVRALAALVVGAAGIWWVLRGHAAFWWAQATGITERWTLVAALVQVALIAVAGALLFGGAKNLAGLLAPASDARHRGAATTGHSPGDRWASWWSSRPGLGVMLLAGATAIVVLSGYIVPRVSGWLLGDDLWAAVTAIVVVMTAGLLANTWWWGALSGWWTWAHRPHTPGGGATPMGQIYAGAGVVVLLWFSATAFGLAVPDSYSGPGAMPRARADCPPDCGGSSGGSNLGSNGSQFQPPQMPDPPGQYQGGANSYPGLDQDNGISLYNPAAGQSGPAQGGYSPYPAQGQPGPPANGVQPPNYDAPLQAQAPQQPVQQAPAQQGPQQPAQQPQGQAGQHNQAPQQGQPGQENQGPQQPNQSSDQQRIDDLTRQLHDQQQQSGQDRQRIDDLTKQLQQNTQNQKQQQSPKLPSKDKKKTDKDDQKNRDDQSGDSDLTALLLGASSTRRRKQDGQEQSPDTEALGQDASQAVQGLSGDVQTYVQSGQQIGESAGQAAQGFGQAGQAGASLASSAQSGAVNPEDAITLVQGVSQGIQGTADAVNSGSQIVKTAQQEADQAAQAVGDVNPQLKPQAQQLTKLNDQASQVTDLVGQGAQLTSQGAGAVNTVSSLGAGGMPTDAASQTGTVELMSGTVPDPGGQGRVDAPSIVQKVSDSEPPSKQSVDVSSLNRVGVTQQKKFADPHVPSINDSFEKVAPTPGDSFDLGVYSNGQMWTGDYYQTAGADQGGRGGMYRIPVSPDGKTATGSPVRVAPPANNPDGSPRNPASRLLPTGKADLGNGQDLVFASQVPSPGDNGGFVSNFTWAYNAANPGAAPTGINGISQLSGAPTPDGKMVAVGNLGASGPRHAWLTPQTGTDGWLDPTKWTDLGQVVDGGRRENQVFALPGGGYGLLDSDGPIGIKVAQTPQQLATNPMARLIGNANDSPLPNDPFLSSAADQLLQPYGPEVISVTPNGNGSTLTFLASQWVTDPTRAYRTLMYTVNIGPS